MKERESVEPGGASASTPHDLLALLAALLAASFGVSLLAWALSSRAAAEPAGLIVGPGLLVGVDGPADVEVRGRPLTQPAAAGRRMGGLQRSAGVGLLAFALATLALRQSARRGAKRWLRALWCVPGALGLGQIATKAGASASTSAVATEHVVQGLLLVGLSAVLLVSWRS